VKKKISKKIAVLLMFIFSTISILTGCNLFSTNNYAALSSIVATSGDISITRESLINGYNNGGYQYYSYYGYTAEEAFKKTIDELVDQEYLLSYIDSKIAEDEANGGTSKYALVSADYQEIVSNCFDYVDSALETYIDEVKTSLGKSTSTTTSDDDDSDPDYDPQDSYETKFENVDGYAAMVETADDTSDLSVTATLRTYDEAYNYAITKYNYEKHISGSDNDFKLLVWKRYLTALKTSQKNYGYSDMSDSAVFEREMERLFEANYKSQKLTKFEDVYENANGYVYNEELGRYVVSTGRLNEIVAKYKEEYLQNLATYNTSKTSGSSQFYDDLTDTDNRENYVYYGSTNDETLITCIHILVKFSDDQTDAIDDYEDNTMLSSDAIAQILEQLKSASNTYATQRDLETGENVVDEDGNEVQVSVQDIYNSLKTALKNKTDLSEIVSIFNSYLYQYNVDTGIINAEYDYVVGTETSSMVDTFTEAVRELYDGGNGKVGSISEPILEENDSYSGYHIILYTGTLTNLFNSKDSLSKLNASNVFSKLSSEMTSISYNETLFEKLFDDVAEDNYSTDRTNLVASIKNGTNTVYQTSNFSDLYE
jgi:hypothetical protein